MLGPSLSNLEQLKTSRGPNESWIAARLHFEYVNTDAPKGGTARQIPSASRRPGLLKKLPFYFIGPG
jgi:hypothetical protein